MTVTDGRATTRTRLPEHDLDARSPSGLLRILGFWDGIAVIVGVIIGAGILRTPGAIAGELGRPIPIFAMWIVGAVVALAGALILAELVALLPRVGGKYVYARTAFGPLAGFVTGWSEIVSRGMTAAAKTVVIGEYLVLLSGASGGRGTVRALAVAVAAAFTFLHWGGLRPVRAFQNAATAMKVLILVGVSALAFALGEGFDWRPPPSVPLDTMAWLGALAVSFQFVSFTYYGCDETTKLAEEVRNPQRELPRVLGVGILCVAAIYLLVNAGFLFVLTPAEMAGSPLVAADVATRLLGGGTGALVTVAALVILLSSLNVNFLSLPRVQLAMAQDDLAPGILARVSANGAPRAGVLSAAVVIVVAALSGSFTDLVLVIMWVALTADSLVILALFRLRRTMAHRERPFRVPFYPALPAAVLVVNVALLVGVAVERPWVAALAGLVFAILAVLGVLWIRLRGDRAA